MTEIRRLTATEARDHLAGLAAVLHDCVEGGASVSFLWPFSASDATVFFEQVLVSVEKGERLIFAALLDGRVMGTVQLITSLPPNQPHRAEIAKLLVHRAARGQGLATLLMKHAEQAALHMGKTLLTLDTVTGGPAEKLYEHLGWTSAGVIPNYALFPDGTPCATTVFWKQL